RDGRRRRRRCLTPEGGETPWGARARQQTSPVSAGTVGRPDRAHTVSDSRRVSDTIVSTGSTADASGFGGNSRAPGPWLDLFRQGALEAGAVGAAGEGGVALAPLAGAPWSPRVLAAISEAAGADDTLKASTPRFSGSAMRGAATSSRSMTSASILPMFWLLTSLSLRAPSSVKRRPTKFWPSRSTRA